MSLAATAVFADIAGRSVVPGANDNLSSVAVLVELARSLQERPVRGLRVLLVSTGSEESFMEGMRGFAARHFGSLDPERTEVVVLECLGSPELVVIEGEGMLVMRDYTPAVRDRLAAVAEREGIHLRRGLRVGLATDGLIALKAGYPSAGLGSVTKYKFPLQLPLAARHAGEPGLRHALRRRGAVRGVRARRGYERVSRRARASACSRVAISPA